MPFNIQEILSNINGQNGLLTPAHFMVTVTTSSVMNEGHALRIIPFFCDTAQIPGVSYQSQEILRYGYGVPEKRPTLAVFSEWTASFYCDVNGDIRKFFEEWMGVISNLNISQKGRTTNGLNVYDFQYPNKYQTIIEIAQFDSSGEIVNIYKLINAYPVMISEQQMDWSQGDAILKNNITFAYEYWTSDYTIGGEQSLEAQKTKSLSYSMLNTGTESIRGITASSLIQQSLNILNNNKIII